MSALGKRYAEALLSLAIQQDSVKKVQEDLDYAKKLFSSVKLGLHVDIEEKEYSLDQDVISEMQGLQTFFNRVRLSKEVKNEIVKSCLEGKVSDLTMQFIYILIEKNRISSYDEIFTTYHQMANHELGIKEGIIESVRPMDEAKIHELEKALSTKDYQVVLVPRLNETLISGFKITFENEVIDVSMREKINKMTEMLTGKDDEPWI